MPQHEQTSPTSKTAPSPTSGSASPPIKCDKCADTGEYRYLTLHGVGANQELRHATTYCDCPAGEDAYHLGLERDRMRAWRDANIPSRFQGFSLDSSPWAKMRPELIETFRLWWDSALLWGGFGVGKTGLAVSIARAVLWWDEADRPATIRFKAMPDLMSELRDTYNRREGSKSEQQVLDELRDVDFLILDDIGAEQVKDTGWFEDRLYQIIGHRHSDEKPTIFTSNLSPQQLGARIGERNMWRVVEMCGEHVYHLEGPNQRAQ